MAIDLGKMKKLLAQDIPQVAIAAALGCTEGFISQCLSSQEFAMEVAALRIARLEGASDRDGKLDKLEDVIIEKLETSLAYMMKPSDLLGAFRIINGAVRRGTNGINPNVQPLGQSVVIVLPKVTALSFIQNQNSEIIEAGGRSLATLPSHVLKQMAANKPRVIEGDFTNGNELRSIKESAGTA